MDHVTLAISWKSIDVSSYTGEEDCMTVPAALLTETSREKNTGLNLQV